MLYEHKLPQEKKKLTRTLRDCSIQWKSFATSLSHRFAVFIQEKETKKYFICCSAISVQSKFVVLFLTFSMGSIDYKSI